MSTSSQKPSFQFGQVQRKGPLIAENTSLPVGKLYFNFRTKESSIPWWRNKKKFSDGQKGFFRFYLTFALYLAELEWGVLRGFWYFEWIFFNEVIKNSRETSKSLKKTSFQWGQVQQKGQLIAENTSLPRGKLEFIPHQGYFFLTQLLKFHIGWRKN